MLNIWEKKWLRIVNINYLTMEKIWKGELSQLISVRVSRVVSKGAS